MKKNYLLGILAIIAFCSCNLSFSEEDLDVSPDVFEIPPNKYADMTSYEYYNQTDGQIIMFDFTKDLDEISAEDWASIKIKFNITNADYYNAADNNFPYPDYGKAMIDGVYGVIPRPVGYLDKYEIIPNPGQTTVYIKYMASDVSGIYKIIGDVYYKDNWIGSKYSKAIVAIPDLIEVPRDIWGEVVYTIGSVTWTNNYYQLWHVGGVYSYTWHQQNNYLNNVTYESLKEFANCYIQEYYKSHSEGFILRLNDMSLPYGGMFSIGITWTNDTAIERIDGFGNPYTVLYRKDVDLRVYCPYHKFHRHGVNFDLSLVSDDGAGGQITSMLTDFSIIDRIAIYYNFKFVREGNHYHFKYVYRRIDDPYFPNFPD
ncbi:MAG: hypothetical protein A2014_00935 [Spirochaetes bacterium GWF1_49_6]|nr:MAG: hypothetical protein A2014_00935 [Spirochaetes bacterium GWF1_49_6]